MSIQAKPEYKIGVDEVGRGPLFGRVYAAAVILPDKTSDFDFSKMKDSKKFHSVKKLRETAEYIRKNAVAYHISWRDEKHIDNVNILQATQDAMHEAIQEIVTGNSWNNKEENEENAENEEEQKNAENAENEENSQTPTFKIEVDGNYFRPFTDANTGKFIPYECIIQGDATNPAIAAASIIAKVARDEYITTLCNEFPQLVAKYDLEKNKGYGTLKHRQGIKEHGFSEWHRKTFKVTL